jgi:hypothetical protein
MARSGAGREEDAVSLGMMPRGPATIFWSCKFACYMWEDR